MKGDNSYNICLGGTFSPLHRGHEKLLREAFRRGKRVSVGLTSDIMAQRSRKRTVENYAQRELKLKRLMEELSREYRVDYTIREITDRFGFAVKEELDAIVVSMETESTVDDIDRERFRRGLEPLKRFVVDMVLDDGGRKISSTRVVKGEIDRNGTLKKISGQTSQNRVCIHLGSKNTDKVRGAINAFRKYWSEVQVFKYDVERGQGISGAEGPVMGVKKRVEEIKGRLGSQGINKRDHLVGIESGFIEENGVWFLIHCCHICHSSGESFGLSSGLEIPSDMLENIMVYRGRMFETKDVVGTRTSLIENLSGGSMSRDSLIEQACEMALLSLSSSLKGEDRGK